MPPAVPRLTFTCQQCAQPFQRMACQMKREKDRPKFCSPECRHAAHRKGEMKSCPRCNEPFYAIASQRLLFCSRQCLNDSKRAQSHSYPKVGGRHAHRVNMEAKIGRPLMPTEIVHHMDENKQSPSIDNLELTDHSAHARLHFTGRKHLPDHIRKRIASMMATKRARGLCR